MTMLITGATGKFGSTVIETLLANGKIGPLAVSVRNPDRASNLATRGVDVRHGDFDDLTSLARAFAGVDRLLLVSTDGANEKRIRQHNNAVHAAQAADVKFIAYTSVSNASHNPLDLAEVHRNTEAAIRATHIPFVFLRNNWYLENEIGFVQAALVGSPLTTSAGDGKVGWALRADYARAAASVLASSGHENTIYELGGPLATYVDFAAALSQILGRPVAVNPVDDGGYADSLVSLGLPGFLVQIFAGVASQIRAGALAVEGNDLQKLLGHPATGLEQALEQIVKQLRSGG